MASKKKILKDGDVIMTIHGLEIRANSLYEIDSKSDSNAPDGFQEYGTTKILAADIADVEPAAVWNGAINAWDTGLTKNSALLKSVFTDETIRNERVKELEEYVVKPYEEMIGEGSLRATSDNNEFWDNYIIKVGKGKTFNTAKVEELYQLIILLLKKKITPKQNEKHPDWKNSAYTIVNKAEIVSREEEAAMRKVRCYTLFAELEKKGGTADVMDWLGVRIQDSSSDTLKMSALTRFIENKEDDYKNARDFVLAVEDYLDANKSEVFEIHKNLKELYRLGKGVTFRRGEVYLDEEYVGNNFKAAAKKVAEDRTLKERLISLM